MLQNFPIEIISNIISLLIIVLIIIKFVNYKKKVSVIDGLYKLEEEKKLSSNDKEFIKRNLLEYEILHEKQIGFNKFMYPIFILIAGIFFTYFDFAEAMIHINILVVAFIYFYIKKIHYKNYIELLKGIKI
ncbi:hypothetical protein Arnit_3062 [Arcobacter nitrofigilis DSM 7299]|uniref:Uncharacterized protein n=1 Tax=Arcobacter nitrofigilis (strain ATCC 33309 / DSM 7299 / CCUG 15893 / LMG 7604 / NCTC 12251 / CI) TaxID=572480 RepID=D5V7T9_ARCNC|nr:hypothetical protein [Arcobacter nitrofigilis]ADG94709.1 hypothetical protein Arnit_3062 [Arcobacter nitrofigilis DSM 7299]